MRVVVTGGAGFLGSHFCEKLLSLGHSVLCLDNLATGNSENIRTFEANPRFEYREHDVSKYIDVEGPIDAVAHLASPASPPDYLRLPIPTLKVGALGSHNALGLAKAKGARFLLASTSEVYGDPLVNPQPETYWGNVNPTGPRGVYDEAKRFAEAMVLAYHRYHGLDTRIARIFNTYGPRMRPHDGRVISNFVVQALRGEPITVYGDGSQTRSFCYVSDLVEGFARLLLAESTVAPDFSPASGENGHPGAVSGGFIPAKAGIQRTASADDLDGIHGPVNLGNPVELTVRDVAELVRRITSSRSEIVYKPLPIDDPRQRRPDITRAGKLLGWKPTVRLEEGLSLTIGHFQRPTLLAHR